MSKLHLEAMLTVQSPVKQEFRAPEKHTSSTPSKIWVLKHLIFAFGEVCIARFTQGWKFRILPDFYLFGNLVGTLFRIILGWRGRRCRWWLPWSVSMLWASKDAQLILNQRIPTGPTEMLCVWKPSAGWQAHKHPMEREAGIILKMKVISPKGDSAGAPIRWIRVHVFTLPTSQLGGLLQSLPETWVSFL